jgi:phytoene desaturase
VGAELPADLVDQQCRGRFHLPLSASRGCRAHQWTNEKIENTRYSMGLFVAYFGTKRRYDDCAHHTIALGPRYRELLDDIFFHKTLAEDFSLYVHRPDRDRFVAGAAGGGRVLCAVSGPAPARRSSRGLGP